MPSLRVVLLFAFAVLPAAARADILDQEFTGPGTDATVSIDEVFPRAQTFTAGTSGTLTRIAIPIGRGGATLDSDELTIDVRPTDSGGAPLLDDGSALATVTLLATELDEDNDTLFGLADLGFGYPELGAFSLSEMASVRLPLGLGIERDLWFEGTFPLSVYAAAARTAGRIVLNDDLLQAAAEALRQTE